MNLAARRAAILVAELLTFLLVTAFMTYFISHAAAPELAPGAAPPADFPVVAYSGGAARPEPAHYRVLRWAEWEDYAARRPEAVLLLPERSRALDLGEAGRASFTVTESGESRQAIELVWRAGDEERRSRYLAQARAIEPRGLHVISTKTFLLAALAGFGAGMLVGKLLRVRWLPRPGTVVPLPPRD
ncbi:MAG TPA: hypothetical protein VNK67_02575 [Burkholderiales bacterium]|nr:hypothetical protein [Burkholderiales bacterium]